MLDLTIINSGHRHLVCNGNAQVGWLTACGDRVKGSWGVEVKPVSQIKCPACLKVMHENDA